MQTRSKEFNWDHAMDMAENIHRINEIMLPFQKEEEYRQRKLEKFPKGFHLSGKGYTCAICRDSCSDEETWYDKYGVKCVECQRAIDRGEIPAVCAEDTDTWYSCWDMQSDFNIRRATLRRWIKEDLIKARTVKREKREDALLFLIEENKDFLPPKKMVENYSHTEGTGDGTFTVHIEPWYKHNDPHVHLKGYGILEHIEFIEGELKLKKMK